MDIYIGASFLEHCMLNEVYLPLQKPLLQQDQLPSPRIRTVRRLLPAESSHHAVRVAHHQLTAAVTIYSTGCGQIHEHNELQDRGRSRDLPMSLMRMTLVLAGMCWVKRGFCSSDNMNSCWLEESALAEVAAVKSKRWNQPSAPTATTKFCHTREEKYTTLLTSPPKYSWRAGDDWTHLSFVADVSDCDTGQLVKQDALDE